MRLRNESLKIGKALVWIDPEGRSKPRALLFLVAGAMDIEPLGRIESACRSHIEDRKYTGFSWHAVADPGQISLVDSRLFSAEIARFEAGEFCGLSQDHTVRLLAPVIDHIAGGDPELLPRAGAAVGGPAEGIQFLNRVSELRDLAAEIRAGKSLFLQAPRRMGKTSLMRRLRSSLDEEFETIALNLERDQTAAEVAARLRALLTGEVFRAAYGASQADPARVLRESVDALCRRSPKPLLLFVDELAALLRSIKTGEPDESSGRRRTLDFLSALGEPLESHAARLVVAGSVDWLAYLRSEHNLKSSELPGLFSHLVRVAIKPLDLEHPECELRRVLLGSALVVEPEELSWLCEHVDLTVPYPALKFLDLLLGETRRRGTLGIREFQAHLRDFLATTEAFDDFDEHLRRKCPEVPQAAELVSEALDTIAREPFEGGAAGERVNAVLLRAGVQNARLLQSWLQDTFPVRLEGGRVQFVSRLFRQWWHSQMRGGAPEDE